MLASLDLAVVETAARETLAYLLERSVAGALVFGVALLLWLAFRRWTPARLGAAWFLVPLVVFAAPVERMLPNPWPGPNPVEVALVGTSPVLGDLLVRPRTGVLRPPVVLRDADLELAASATAPEDTALVTNTQAADTAGAGADAARPAAPLPWATVLFGLWLAVVLVLITRLALVQRGVLGVLRRARPLSASEPIAARAVRRLAGRRPLAVLETDELASPATWGLGKRALLIPTGLSGRLDPPALEWVVRHELAHLERRDHAIDLAQRLVQIAFFFHPLVWFANRHVRALRELACDEAAQVRCAPSERGLCARALLDVAAFASGLTEPRTDHAMVSLLDSKTLLRNRIMNLSTPERRTAQRTLGPLALVGFSLAALGTLAPAQFRLDLEDPVRPAVAPVPLADAPAPTTPGPAKPVGSGAPTVPQPAAAPAATPADPFGPVAPAAQPAHDPLPAPAVAPGVLGRLLNDPAPVDAVVAPIATVTKGTSTAPVVQAPQPVGLVTPGVLGQLLDDPFLEAATVEAIGRIASSPPAVQDPSPHKAQGFGLAVVADVDESVQLAQGALERGLAWLIAEQAEDGGWHDVQSKLPGVPQIVPYFDDIGATALAVQALARHCKLWPNEPAALKGRDRALVRGLDHLLKTQNENGSFGPQHTFVYLVGHALGTEALALGISHLAAGEPAEQPVTKRYREALVKAVAFAEASRNPYGGWRYDHPPVGDNDSMQTGRMLVALVEAFAVEVHASPQAFAGGYNWFEEMHDPQTGRMGYTGGSTYALRIIGRQTEFPMDKVELSTALDMILLVSRESVDIDRMSGGAKLLLAKPPAWSRAIGTTDFTYWMYGTRAMGIVGGLLAERWNEAALEALLPHQLQTGDDAGAWPGADAWSAPGLRTYPTAANCMTLMDVVAAG